MAKTVDARGLPCPQPVIMTRNALRRRCGHDHRRPAQHNVTRMAEKAGCTVRAEERDDGIYLHIARGYPASLWAGESTPNWGKFSSGASSTPWARWSPCPIPSSSSTAGSNWWWRGRRCWKISGAGRSPGPARARRGDPGLWHLPGVLRPEGEDSRGRGIQYVHHRRDDADFHL